MTDVVPIYRRVARGDPVGRFEKLDRPARSLVGLFKQSRRSHAESDGQSVDGTREHGLFVDQMIVGGLADSRAFQEGVEGNLPRTAEFSDILP